LKTYPTESIRNVAVVSHANAGKTSLVEAMLFNARVMDRLGRVDDGNTTADFDAMERERGISIAAALCAFEHRATKINALDTPGYADFVAEAIGCLRVADAALVVVDANAGVEIGTERVWQYADRYGLARAVVINRMDKEGASFEGVVEAVHRRLSSKAVPLHVPIGSAGSFKGYVDIVAMKAFTAEGAGPERMSEIPADMADAVRAAREALIEGVAETSDELLEKYFEAGTLDQADVAAALKPAIQSGHLIPIICASATANIGALAAADLVATMFPAPRMEPFEGTKPGTDERVTREPSESGPFTAYVFKTIIDEYIGRISLMRICDGKCKGDTQVLNTVSGMRERISTVQTLRGKTQDAIEEADLGDIVAVARLNDTLTGHTLCAQGDPIVMDPTELPESMFSASLTAKSRDDEEKVAQALGRLSEEDVALRFYRDHETEESIISGAGQLHLELAIRRLKEKGIEVSLGKPKTAYRETIRARSEGMYRHKKQTGGRGQFAQVSLRVEPLPEGVGFEFVNEIRGAVISGGYIPGVEKGAREGMARGVLAGFPVEGVRVTVFDGKEHPVDSSELAFKIAASRCFSETARKCQPILLEPIVNVDIVAPEECTGDIISDMNGKRGRIVGMDPAGANQVLHAQAPLAEMGAYGAELRSMTGGRASFSVSPSRYEEVPAHLVDGIIKEYGRKIEDEEE